MKLLVIGTDLAVFKEHAETRGRIEAYGRLFDELHVIVYSPPGFYGQTLPSGARLYPTNSRFFLLRPFDAARLGRRIAHERGIDVVSVQDPAESGLAGWLIKRSAGLPLHIQVHSDILSPHFRRNSWKERVRYWLARFIIGRGDYVRAVSQRVADSLQSALNIPRSRITVLPIFVDRERIANAPPAFNLHERYPEFDFIILMVSRLNRDKRIDLALGAFAVLCREFPKTGLVVVGNGPESQTLKRETRALKFADSVRFEGWREDVVSYYKTADLYLLTSAFEGYGRTVVEAAASGLPIVMTDVGVAGELIRDHETGRVVRVGDRAALIRALREARRTYPAMRAMADRARSEALAMEPRTWEEYLRRYRDAYREAAGARIRAETS